MSSANKTKIPLKEILLATNNFDENNVIGKGGFGNVYRGESQQHGPLAVKRLRVGSDHGDREYGMEVTLLSKYKHENLVSLVGYCKECSERILVYRLEVNGSLEKFLHRKDLRWMRRLQICLGVARGLRFLHDETGIEHGIIHRDIKSANILLDENCKAKISDFGFAKIALTKSADSFIHTRACGTPVYVDPEYILDGNLTQKSDVYSFGVVLFEVLFRKLCIPIHAGYQPFKLDTAREHYENNKLHLMIDTDLRKEMNSDSLSTFSSIAYECIKKRREDHPTMSLVVEALEKALHYQPAPSGFLHDVYISFRRQTTAEYVDRLCDALKKEGLSTYKDNTRTHKESVLRSAIKQSASFIILFSKNFSSNSWNLEEVADIMKCVRERRSPVIPVFLDVYPSEVREQKAFFGSGMSKYDIHPDIRAWRKALAEAANVPGLEESDYRSAKELAEEAAARIKAQLLGER